MKNQSIHILLKKRIQIFLLVSVLILLVALTLLSKINTLRVTDVFADKTSVEENYVTTDNRIVFEFSRPLKSNEDLKNLISFEPEFLDFDARIVNNSIIVDIEGFLEKDTDYIITIQKGIKDIYNQSISSDYEHRFQTQNSEIIFIRDDTIHIQDISQKTADKIYTSSTIEDIKPTKDGRYIYIFERETFVDSNLIRYDRQAKQIQRFGFSSDYNVIAFDIDLDNNIWLVLSAKETAEKSFGVIDQSEIRSAELISVDIEIIESLQSLSENVFRFNITNYNELILKTFADVILSDFGTEFIKTYPNHEDIGFYNKNNDDYFNYINYYLPEGDRSELYILDFNERLLVDRFDEAIKQISYLDEANLAIMTQRRLDEDLNFIYQVLIYNYQEKSIIKKFRESDISFENPVSDIKGNLLALEQKDITQTDGNSDIIIFSSSDLNDEILTIMNASDPVWIN